MGLRHLVLIAFLDDTIDKASEIDTYAIGDGPQFCLPQFQGSAGFGLQNQGGVRWGRGGELEFPLGLELERWWGVYVCALVSLG